MKTWMTSALAVIVGAANAQMFTPPATLSLPVTQTVHGVRLTDPYQWLEDKAAPAVQTWTRAQHEATLQWLNTHAPTPAGLRTDLASLFDRTVSSAPSFYKGQMFYTRKEKGEAQAKLFTRIGERELLLFDPMQIDPTGKTAITTFAHSRHDALMSVAVQRAGSEIDDSYFIDRTNGAARFAPLLGVRGVQFTAIPGVIHFTIRNKELIDRQVPLHVERLRLGEPLSAAQRIVENDDAKNLVDTLEPERSPYRIVEKGDFLARTITVEKLGAAQTTAATLFASKKARANVELVGTRAYLRSNENASNFKIEMVDISNLARPLTRKTIVPERADTVVQGFVVTKNHLIVREKKNLAVGLALYDLDGRPSTRVTNPPEMGDVADVAYDHHADQLYVALSTFNAPFILYRVDPNSFVWTKIFQDDAGIDTAKIETERFDVPTRDGKRVPIYVSKQKGTQLTGKNPTLLYGYGGFNIGMRTRFLGSWAALINRGVVFVEAGIRGGDEFGEAWHQDGMQFKKQNTFNDFIDVAQWLIDNQYTRPDKLAIMGGSNGGLLVGAAATQRPDLFKAVICSVPLLDMLRFHKFLIARYWIPEYGDPDKPAEFRHLLTYSPYHNIRIGTQLPAMMVIAGENDSRVDPLHAKKFVARAQANQGQDAPILLKVDFDSGHGTGKSTAQQIEDREVWMRFLLSQISG